MPFLPRRHRRRLLLPPGLLALAGLLLLGCLTLRPWWERLTQPTVIQLTMPVRPRPGDDYREPTVRNVVPDPDTLRRQYPLHQAHFAGTLGQHGGQQQLINALHEIAADTMNGGMVSVQLEANAHYADMIFLLDLMLREQVRSYWFDFTRHPATFYALQRAYRPQLPLFTCGTSYRTTCLPMPKARSAGVQFDAWVTEFWRFQWLRQLWELRWQEVRSNSEWRVPLALLGLLSLLNLRRLLARAQL